MGVYDFAESKYNVGSSSFSKLAPKRPAIVTLNEKSNKVQKIEENKNYHAELSSETNIELQRERKSLPVYIHRKGILDLIRNHNTLIIIGETGSGKSTQIPQLVYAAGIAGRGGCIGVTEPRRVAAVTLARRVAQEQGEACPGKRVGYCVRFDEKVSADTRIKYVTDGMMVREAMTDEVLSNYSIIVLDEAHERSVHTDVLFGVTKRAQSLRKLKNHPPLKLIIMSATMDVEKFADYFQAKVAYIEGRQHEVEIFHATKPQDDYVFAALSTVFQINRESPPNEDILVFLTGQEEIENAVMLCRGVAKLAEGKGFPSVKVFPLYSALPTHQQLEAFRPSPPGMRKVVISTNIAETSVTIGGIRHIIDTGVVKTRMFHPTTGFDSLKVEKVSKAQAQQRTGRAGRLSSGCCYRTYTKVEYESLADMPIPEILRCSLVGVALQLLAIGIDITTFDFMDKPPKEAIEVAVACLEKLGAVRGSPPQLTTLGRTMSRFPLDPRFTKVILASVEHQCLEEALSVIAMLSGESVFNEPPTRRRESAMARTRFASEEGDHITLLRVYRHYVETKEKKVFCKENYLHHRNLEYACNVRKQLAETAERANLEKSSCGTNTENLRKALLEGLYDNVAELQRDQTYMTLGSRQTVAIHPSSVLHNSKHPLVLFTEIVCTGKNFMRGLSVIETAWLR